MDALEGIRIEIDDIDKRLAGLFEQRLEAVARAGEYKLSHGLPTVDADREAHVLESSAEALGDSSLVPLHREFQRELISLARARQEALSDPPGSLRIYAGGSSYPVIIGSGLLERTRELLKVEGKVLIVTDEGVPVRYLRAMLELFPGAPVVTLPQWEGSKTLASLELILTTLMDEGFTRSDALVALGGGMVCDVAGFAAACYMRGIRWYAVPTTLLSQLDASVGGKTAVNLGGVKNVAGAFHNPCGVLADTSLTATLPPKIFSEGMAELIKIAAVADAELFRALEDVRNILPPVMLENFVRKAVTLKAEAVSRDPRDHGTRASLNFGHTIGHAVESLSGATMLHGECVAIGMLYTSTGEARERIATLLRRWSLPLEDSFSPQELIGAAMHDKKRSPRGIRLVMVDTPGECRYEWADEAKLLKIIEERRSVVV